MMRLRSIGLVGGVLVAALSAPALAQQIPAGTWSSGPGDPCEAFAGQATAASSCEDGDFYDGKTYKMQGGFYTKVYLKNGRIMYVPTSGAESNSADPGGNRK